MQNTHLPGSLRDPKQFEVQTTGSLCPLVHVLPVAGGPSNASVIFLHGSGDNAFGGFPEEIREQMSMSVPVSVWFPTAPYRNYSLMGGAPVNVWFDRTSLGLEGVEDTEGTLESCELVHALVNKEVERGVPLNRIFVGGFSQGGCLALHYAYASNRANGPPLGAGLGGVFAISSFVPSASRVFEGPKAGSLPPLWQSHGDADGLIDHSWGRATHDRLAPILKSCGADATWTTYRGRDHEPGPALKHVAGWIAGKLA
mmetsp:Transcript_15392/g.36365  ORF Transcript_15392/g.36365 Transcript_15392/m.36365 type:complete len:256 (-) Transcript_15392:154-921(-)